MIFYTASYGLSRVVIDLTRIFDIKTVIPSASLELATQGVTLAFVASAFIIIGYGLANSMPKTQDSLSGILSLAKPKKEGQLSNLGLESIPQDGSLDSSGGLTDHVLLKTEGISDIRYEACKSIGKKYDLTERELVVLTYLSQGHTNQHIAGEMYISINTVKTHTQAIYNKTGCHSKQEVINLIDQTIAKR
ncbi:MAG: response regulator transcription factor [Coriobacteriales bacterium]|nr:response regulator transcription factor [Coriobacteriales bacterium]